MIATQNIVAVATIKFIVIIACQQQIITRPAVKYILATAGAQTVVAAVADKDVVGIVAETKNIIVAGHRQVFNIIRQRISRMGINRIRTLAVPFNDLVIPVVHNKGIVS